MLLHARRKKHVANSYLYLFDEPGVFLHPQGQKDLIRVFERLSGEAQLVYTTHSLFMLNHNFPERHRLVLRRQNGTTIDQKSHRANWRFATDALGIYLTSNILFSSRVLLVEGDSDPIHIYELFRQLNHSQKLDADANALGIFSFSDLPNLRFLLQVFAGENTSANVMVLVDGDRQGRTTVASVKKLCERLKVPVIDLLKEHSIEDYILSEKHLADAVLKTLNAALDSEGLQVPPTLAEDVKTAWTAHCKKPETNTGMWFNEIAKTHLGGETASKVGLARTYAFLCREDADFEPDADRINKALNLCQDISTRLAIPKLRAEAKLEEADQV